MNRGPDATDPPTSPARGLLQWGFAALAVAYAAFVQDLIDLGVVPVLSTIPPEGAHTGDTRVEDANNAIRALADEMRVPWVDFHALVLHYQPVGWLGTLISADGTHPSAGGRGQSLSLD